MKLIVGLGNPEPRYELTRHNVGYWVLDQCALLAGAQFKSKAKFKSNIAEMSIGDQTILLAKPTTYYNDSGAAVRSIAEFYRIEPHDILVIYDDLSLPFGTIRTRQGGRDAGNNGIKSINSLLADHTHRIRIGTDTDMRQTMGDADFVLAKFSTAEIVDLTKQLVTITDQIDRFISGNHQPTTKRLDPKPLDD